MRGHLEDDTDRPRPIFSRSADGRLRAGSNNIASTPAADDGPAPRKEPPLLIIPSQPQSPPIETIHQTHIQSVQHVSTPQVANHSARQPEMSHTAATDAPDVGDIWSEQERIRLQENWEEEQRKQVRKRRRREMFRRKVTGIPSASEQLASIPPQPSLATAAAAVIPEPVQSDAKEITLNISMPSMPKLSLPKVRVPALPRISKGRALLFGGIAAAVIAGGVGYNLYRTHHTAKQPAVSSGGIETTANGVHIQHLDPSKQTGKPDYDTVLPAGKKIEDFGGWVRVSPPDKNPVYAYADEIDDVLINVSEQPVPETFKQDVGTAMDDLAAQYSANDKIKVGSITAYVGTSLKGPQSVLFVKGDLLILMKSASKIADNHWETYIRSLQ